MKPQIEEVGGADERRFQAKRLKHRGTENTEEEESSDFDGRCCSQIDDCWEQRNPLPGIFILLLLCGLCASVFQNLPLAVEDKAKTKSATIGQLRDVPNPTRIGSWPTWPTSFNIDETTGRFQAKRLKHRGTENTE